METDTTKHTPGPWAINGGVIGNADEIFKSTRFEVCRLPRINGEQTETDYANARLIAAAPDGYDLALFVKAYFSEYKIHRNEMEQVLFDKAVAYLAKAEGRV